MDENAQIVTSTMFHYKEKYIDFSDGILKPHNQEIYKKIVKGYETSNKVLIEQATGTGKSFLSMKLIKDYALNQGKKVLFVSPTKVIKKAFIKNCKQHLGTTKGISTCLYAGLNRKVESQYDLIIFDEVHHIGAPVWGESVQKIMGNNPNAQILGMTATLERADSVKVEEILGVNEPVSRYTLVDAIEQGVLPAPDYTLALVGFKDDLEYFAKSERELMEQMKTACKEDRKKIENLLVDIAEAKKQISNCEQIPEVLSRELSKEELKSGKFIVFCPAGADGESKIDATRMDKIIKEAQETWFKATGQEVATYVVHSKYSDKQNEEQISQFEQDNSDKIKLLFLVNMLNEGKHVDDINGIIMLRSTSSKSIFLQQLGRALSVGHKKQPKIFDFVANLTNGELEEMRSLTDTINNDLKEREGKNSFEDDDEGSELREFILKIENLKTFEFINNVKEIISNLSSELAFNKFIEELEAYKNSPENTNHDLLVPQCYENPETGYKLGKKVSKIRIGAVNINAEQKEKLDEIGFVWDAKSFDFEDFIRELEAYRNSPENKNHDLLVPRDYINNETGYKLGQKVSNIRSGNTRTTEEQKKKLNEMGFVWDATVRFDFDEFVRELEAYRNSPENKNRDLLVPAKNKNSETGYKLGQKVQSIRSGDIKITEEQKKELNEIGFVWDAQSFDFEEFIRELEAYRNSPKNTNHDLFVPKNYQNPETGCKLGKKVSNIRSGAVKITDEQKKKLDEIGFIWDATVRFDFEEFVRELEAYRNSPENKNRDLLVPAKYKNSETGYKLGQEAVVIRRGQIKITDEQKEILDEKGFVFDTQENNFVRFMQELLLYKYFNKENANHDLLVPQRYENLETGYKLGQKVNIIRSGKAKTTDEQKARLNEIGFIWNVAEYKKSLQEQKVDVAQVDTQEINQNRESENSQKLDGDIFSTDGE